MKESCSILEQTTTKNGGTASCRSAVFFAFEEEDGRGQELESERMGEESEDVIGLGEDGRGVLEGRELDFERKKKGL